MTDKECQEVIKKAASIDVVLKMHHPELHSDFRELWKFINKQISSEYVDAKLGNIQTLSK